MEVGVAKPIIEYIPTTIDLIRVGKKAIITLCDTQRETLTGEVLSQLTLKGIPYFETKDALYRPRLNA